MRYIDTGISEFSKPYTFVGWNADKTTDFKYPMYDIAGRDKMINKHWDLFDTATQEQFPGLRPKSSSCVIS